MSTALAKRRRALEDEFRSREEYVRNDFKLGCVANWEERTTRRIESHCTTKSLDEVRQKHPFRSIEEKRKDLKLLYDQEMESWKQQIISTLNVSMEDKMENIRSRAYQLKEERERERKRFVAECYERQWRDGCDDYRQQEAKAMSERLIQDRKVGLDCSEQEDKVAIKAVEARALQLENEKFQKREEEERLALRNKNKTLRMELDEQVRQLSRIKLEAQRANKNEEQLQIERWLQEDEKEKEKTRQQMDDARLRGLEAIQTNIQRQCVQEIKSQDEKEKDLLLLQYALRKEREQIEADIFKKEEQQEQTRQYTTFLREQMIKEKVDTSQVDSIRSNEMEKIWIKRDKEIEARNQARNDLMVQVQQGRIEQMKEKRKLQKEYQQEMADSLHRDMMEVERKNQEEKQKQEEARQVTIHNTQILKEQMTEKESIRQKEQQEKYLLSKQIQYSEKKRANKLSFASPSPPSSSMHGGHPPSSSSSSYNFLHWDC